MNIYICVYTYIYIYMYMFMNIYEVLQVISLRGVKEVVEALPTKSPTRADEGCRGPFQKQVTRSKTS